MEQCVVVSTVPYFFIIRYFHYDFYKDIVKENYSLNSNKKIISPYTLSK